ncbi:MAG: hypothetical protein KKD18_01085 [Nanoarchaeota archaeon]|nr:hypothetical protein [Nanoarchaeota archaeon]MBU0976989.1 hypothetical protein [Nanoarchaeota archaeon]
MPISRHPILNYSPDRAAELSLLRNVIDQALGELTQQQRDVLGLRFGLSRRVQYGYAHTLEECRPFTGLTRERVSQIHREAIEKLRHSRRIHGLERFAYLSAPV